MKKIPASEYMKYDKFIKDEPMSVLDEIRAEIMSLTNGDTPERIWNVDVLEILDKYKAESEGEG